VTRRPVILLALLGCFGVRFCGAAEPPKDAAKDQAQAKESYLKKADHEVQDWTNKIKSLEERSQNRGEKTREDLDRHVKAVNDHLAAARAKLEALRNSSTGAWNTMRHGLEEALDKVKHDYQKALSFFDKNENKVIKADKEKKS